MTASLSGSPLIRLVLLCALVSPLVSCSGGGPDGSTNSAKTIANAGNVGNSNGNATRPGDSPKSDLKTLDFQANAYNEGTVAFIWPSDDLQGKSGSVELIFLDGLIQSAHHIQPLSHAKGSEGPVSLAVVPNKSLKQLTINLPDPTWDVLTIDDPRVPANGKTRVIHVFYMQEAKILAGGSFTTPIGFTITLTQP